MPDPSRTRIKICGLTTLDDARFTAALGVDAIGLVFYEKSPRYVDLAVARDIALAVGPLVTVVGLFVNAERDLLKAALAEVPLHVLQFHGDEDNSFCRSFNRPFMKAIRMAPGLDVAAEMARYPDANGILLDAYQPGVPGGTGTQFEWQRFPRNPHRPTILAGGLTPANVAAAVGQTKPYGVDVSGGVELSPGRKCPTKVAEFVSQVANT